MLRSWLQTLPRKKRKELKLIVINLQVPKHHPGRFHMVLFHHSRTLKVHRIIILACSRRKDGRVKSPSLKIANWPLDQPHIQAPTHTPSQMTSAYNHIFLGLRLRVIATERNVLHFILQHQMQHLIQCRYLTSVFYRIKYSCEYIWDHFYINSPGELELPA